MSDLNWDDVLGGVDAEEKENPSGSGDFDTLPKGPYPVIVQEAEKLVASTGKDMIKVRVQVTEGPFANRVLFNYIVFSQDNPKAMRMTLERLAAFGVTRELIATTKPSIPQIAELLVGRKAVAVVGIQGKDAGQYEGSNEIKSFKPLDGVAQPAPTVTAPKPAGVPTIPTPAPEAVAPPAPSVPLPEVPGAEAAAEPDPFG